MSKRGLIEGYLRIKNTSILITENNTVHALIQTDKNPEAML